MRRAGVGPWIATVAVGSLLLFGGGAQTIVVAASVNLVASFVFGLSQLILADHDGDWQRRDWLGLLAGLAALLCSGVGLAMAVIVGMATWTRRGWRWPRPGPARSSPSTPSGGWPRTAPASPRAPTTAASPSRESSSSSGTSAAQPGLSTPSATLVWSASAWASC